MPFALPYAISASARLSEPSSVMLNCLLAHPNRKPSSTKDRDSLAKDISVLSPPKTQHFRAARACIGAVIRSCTGLI